MLNSFPLTPQRSFSQKSVQQHLVDYYGDVPDVAIAFTKKLLSEGFKDFGVNSDLSATGIFGLFFKKYDDVPARRINTAILDLEKLNNLVSDRGLLALEIVLDIIAASRSNQWSAGVMYEGRQITPESLNFRLMVNIIEAAGIANCRQELYRNNLFENHEENIKFFTCLRKKIATKREDLLVSASLTPDLPVAPPFPTVSATTESFWNSGYDNERQDIYLSTNQEQQEAGAATRRSCTYGARSVIDV